MQLYLRVLIVCLLYLQTLLHLSSCRNIRDKTVANDLLAQVLAKNAHLIPLLLNIADDAGGGAALARLPFLPLVCVCACMSLNGFICTLWMC
jgi:hypothetical protein